MKKVLVLGGKKYDTSLFNGYEVVVEKKVDKAIKRVFADAPDVILTDLATTSFHDCYYFENLIKKIDVTKNIPFAVLRPKTLNQNFDLFKVIDSEQDLKTLAGEYNFSETEKKEILEYKLTNSCLKTLSTEIMDKMIVQSSILDDIKSLVNYMNDDYALSLNIFKLFDKYISYDLCGLYFNESNESSKNVLNLSLPNENITINQIEKLSNKFFDEFENKYKRINEVQTALVSGDISDKFKLRKFDTEIILPYMFSENLTGGIYLLANKKMNIFEKMFFDVITHELELIFKFKFMFNEQLKHALQDSMTGLFNRQEFEANLEKEFNRARRYIYNFTLAFIDIDEMGKINESYGDKFGNFVIYQLAQLLKEVFRRTDLLYRFGGDKIIVFMPMTPITKAIIPIERLKQKISEYKFKKDGVSTNITVSIGLCANYSRFTDTEHLMNSLKVSLIRAKEAGKNKLDIYE